MYPAYNLNKQDDNIQSQCTAFLILNQSMVPCLVLTVTSWLAYWFLRRQGRWSGILISLRIFHLICTVKSFSLVNEAEVDIFLEFSCFFYDSMDVGNLISGSSAFSKSSLNIWNFMVHILLKPGLENFEYYFAIMWNVYNSLALPFLGLEWKLTFSSPVATSEFSKFVDILSVALSL